MAGKKKASRVRYQRRRKLKRYNVKKHYSTSIGRILGSSLSFPFPSMLQVLLRVEAGGSVVQNAGAIAGNPVELNYKFNCCRAVGPSLNYPLGSATTYSGNEATGAAYLISNNNTGGGGAIAPYTHCLVRGSSISVEVSTEGTTNVAHEIGIRPMSINAQSAPTVMQTSQFMEQPMAKGWVIPPILNDKIQKFKHSCSTKKLFGLSSLDTSNTLYTHDAGTDPNQLGSWSVRLSNLGGGLVARSLSVRTILVYDCVFFGLNYMTSATP